MCLDITIPVEKDGENQIWECSTSTFSTENYTALMNVSSNIRKSESTLIGRSPSRKSASTVIEESSEGEEITREGNRSCTHL
jgi:hypothetical protein